MLIGATAVAPLRMTGRGMFETSRSTPRTLPPSATSHRWSSWAPAETSTTLPARATAAPRASSSFRPNIESLSKMMSRPMTSGRSARIRSMSSPCSARGNGHWRLSSWNDDSSIVTMTIGAVGGRGPRSSKSWSNHKYSHRSSGPTSTSATTKRAAPMPQSCFRSRSARRAPTRPISATLCQACPARYSHSPVEDCGARLSLPPELSVRDTPRAPRRAIGGRLVTGSGSCRR